MSDRDELVIVAPNVASRLSDFGVPITRADEAEPPRIPLWAKLVWDAIKIAVEHRPSKVMNPLLTRLFNSARNEERRAEIMTVVGCLDNAQDREQAIFEFACQNLSFFCKCGRHLKLAEEIATSRCAYCSCHAVYDGDPYK